MNWASIGTLALVIVVSSAGAERLRAEVNASDNTASPDSVDIEETWARIAPEMGRHLPMKVDDNTTWLTVSNEGHVLVSTFRKDLSSEEILALKSEMEQSAIENTCRGTQRGKELLEAGGVMRQVFYDREDQLVVTINVDGKSCEQP